MRLRGCLRRKDVKKRQSKSEKGWGGGGGGGGACVEKEKFNSLRLR